MCQQAYGVLEGQGASISQTSLEKRACETDIARDEKARPCGSENLAKNLWRVEKGNQESQWEVLANDLLISQQLHIEPNFRVPQQILDEWNLELQEGPNQLTGFPSI